MILKFNIIYHVSYSVFYSEAHCVGFDSPYFSLNYFILLPINLSDSLLTPVDMMHVFIFFPGLIVSNHCGSTALNRAAQREYSQVP